MASNEIGGLTEREVQVFAYLRNHIGANISAPPYKQIQKDLGLADIPTVSRLVKRLEDHGYLRRVMGRRGAIVITSLGMDLKLPEKANG